MNIKNQASVLFLFFISLPVWCQSPRLIIRSDDMGAFHSVNVACIDTYKNGITTAVEVMPVASWFPEAVYLLRENPGLDVGVHLAITSEWDYVKWRPLTCCPNLTDSNGYFYPRIWPNPSYPQQSVLEREWNISEIEAEFRAQIEVVQKNIPRLSHISGHMGSTAFNEEVANLVGKLAEEYGLILLENKSSSVNSVSYNGPKKDFKDRESSFITMLYTMEAGKDYLFVDHPGLDNDEMSTVGHPGYENVADDRQGVTDLLKSDKVKRVIKERGIKLIPVLCADKR
jgi:predicted glycoside hydrolase/deacetylase ChbG (UPF0249 family)